jgi:putative membrane protein
MFQRHLALLASFSLLLSACAMNTSTATMDLGPNATSESDIASIVMAANEGEVEQGRAASTRATSEEVRSFAQMMVTEHTNAMNAGRDTFNRAGINASENNISTTLRSNSAQTVTNLATYQGAAFDRMYVETQVALHDWLLRSLDTALIPSARTPEVRTLLQTQRASVAMHLEHARTLLNRLPRS